MQTTTRPEPTVECRYCASQRVIPVLFERMERAGWQPGNPFRQFCLECDRWLQMCSREAWERHPEARVLPATHSPDVPLLIPVEDTDFADRVSSAPAANQFDCPACGVLQTGYPDQCNRCSVPFEWSQ